MDERKPRVDRRKLYGLIAVAVALPATAALAVPAAAQPPAEAAQAQQEGAAQHPAAEFPELRRGDRGSAVKVAQRLLTYHGHRTAADGIFGPHTERRVRELQEDGDLPVDGVVDAATWGRLVEEVRRGDRGEVVRIVQWLLTRNGYHLAQDGIFGPKTESATRKFQKAEHLPTSGVAGLETWRALVSGVQD